MLPSHASLAHQRLRLDPARADLGWFSSSACAAIRVGEFDSPASVRMGDPVGGRVLRACRDRQPRHPWCLDDRRTTGGRLSGVAAKRAAVGRNEDRSVRCPRHREHDPRVHDRFRRRVLVRKTRAHRRPVDDPVDGSLVRVATLCGYPRRTSHRPRLRPRHGCSHSEAISMRHRHDLTRRALHGAAGTAAASLPRLSRASGLR